MAVRPMEPTETPAAQDALAATSSPSYSIAPLPVVAKDSEMAITDVTVGDPAFESAVQFSVNKAGTVLVRSASESSRLFRVRTDQLGRVELLTDELAPESGGVLVAIPGSGSYLVAGQELPLPFQDEPMAVRSPPAQAYRVQAAACSQEILTQLDPPISPFDRNHVAIAAWTHEPRVPTMMNVYIHHAAGGEDRPVRYSFQEVVDGAQPQGFVVNYIRDTWNTRLTADVAARDYNKRWSCDDSDTLRLDLCHSAGCLKALIAFLQAYDENLQFGWNNIGIIAASPAFGGSHTQIKALFDAWIALSHKPVRFSSLYLLVQRDLGFLGKLDPKLLVLREILTGSPLTLYNELGRSLAWHGRGPTGMEIPSLPYEWYSRSLFGTAFPKRLLKPQSRFLTPTSNVLVAYAPEKYINVNDGGGEYFNFVEALQQYQDTLVRRPYDPEHTVWFTKDGVGYKRAERERGMTHVDKKVNVIVTYLNGSDVQKNADAFENKDGSDEKLTNMWRLIDPSSEYRLAFEKAAMPWIDRFIATAPSVTPHNVTQNESAANDGALTVAQQLGLLATGSSIIAPDSRYGALKINDTAIKERLPGYIDEYARFEGRDHIDAGVTDPETREQIKQWIIKRRAALEGEERSTVLTEQDKTFMRDSLFPKDGYGWYSLSVSGLSMNYGYRNLSSLQYVPDPDSTGQKNLVAVVGSGPLEYYTSNWNSTGNIFSETYHATWRANHRFVKRNGVWLLVQPRR